MTPQAFSEWLASLSISERIGALAAIYSSLTVYTRQLFLPEWTARKELLIDKLHGMNEIHHTLSNALLAYATDGKYPHSLDGLGRMLLDNANNYQIEFFLESAVESARTNSPT
jgi:hypothetical protein